MTAWGRPPRLLKFARAAVTEFHRLGSFKTDSSHFWSLEIQEEGVSRTVSSEDPLFLYYYFLFMNHMGVDADDKLSRPDFCLIIQISVFLRGQHMVIALLRA